MKTPFAICYAGPYGSGKTSILEAIKVTGLQALDDFFPMPDHFLNPDKIAKELPGPFVTQKERNQAAFHKGIELREAAIEQGLSFAYETVFSHPSRVNEFLRLKQKGYRILMVFIATNDVEINVRRVLQRVETQTTTGHYVDPDTVRDRYGRVMNLLPTAAEFADAVFIYDNSNEFAPPTQEVLVDGMTFSVLKEQPVAWIERYFSGPIRLRAHQLKQFFECCEDKGGELMEADILYGSYHGVIVMSSTFYVLQDIGLQHFILHDRAMLDTAKESHRFGIAKYRLGDNISVVYGVDSAPVVTANIK